MFLVLCAISSNLKHEIYKNEQLVLCFIALLIMLRKMKNMFLIFFPNKNQSKKIFRVQLSHKVAETIKLAFKLLGIEVPERM